MANIWESDTYNITKIEVKTKQAEVDGNGTVQYTESSPVWTGNSIDGNPIETLEAEYIVTIQRLPASSYPLTTDVFIDRFEYYSNILTYSSSDSTFVADILPIINTSLAAYDAEYDGSTPETLDKTGFSIKTL